MLRPSDVWSHKRASNILKYLFTNALMDFDVNKKKQALELLLGEIQHVIIFKNVKSLSKHVFSVQVIVVIFLAIGEVNGYIGGRRDVLEKK